MTTFHHIINFNRTDKTQKPLATTPKLILAPKCVERSEKYIESQTIDRTDLKPIDKQFISKFEDFCQSFRKSFKSLSPRRADVKWEGFQGSPFEQTADTKEELKVCKQESLRTALDINPICISGRMQSNPGTKHDEGTERPDSNLQNKTLNTSQTIREQRDSTDQSSFLNDDNSFQYRMDRHRISSFVQQDPKYKLKVEQSAGKINPSELEIIKQIGSGSFGTVYLWYSYYTNYI